MRDMFSGAPCHKLALRKAVFLGVVPQGHATVFWGSSAAGPSQRLAL